MYLVWADARVFGGLFDNATKKLLEDLLDATENSIEMGNELDRKNVVLLTRIHLSLVLQKMGVDLEAQRRYDPQSSPGCLIRSLIHHFYRHTDWAVKYLRKNRLHRETISAYIRRRDQPSHPVAEALGSDWFDDKQLTTRDEKALQMNQCKFCAAPGTQKKLSRCVACSRASYW